MFWKDRLAHLILDGDDVSYLWLIDQQSWCPSLRVKTIDAKGKVPVIQLSGRGEWLKPKEWAHDHIYHLKQQHSELQARLEDLGCDPTESAESSSAIPQLVSSVQSDPAVTQMLREENEKLKATIKWYHRELLQIANGKKMSLEMIEHLNLCQKDRVIYMIESGR